MKRLNGFEAALNACTVQQEKEKKKRKKEKKKKRKRKRKKKQRFSMRFPSSKFSVKGPPECWEICWEMYDNTWKKYFLKKKKFYISSREKKS